MEQTNDKRKRTTISPQLIENVVRDYHELKSSLTDLSIRYKCAYHTVEKIIKNNPYGFWDSRKMDIIHGFPVKPSVNEIRKTLTYDERKRLLIQDALKVVELGFDAVINLLETNPKSLNVSQLVSIVQTVAPFVITKADSKRSKEMQQSNKDDLVRSFLNDVSKISKNDTKNNIN
jgi:hypothetical protein